MKKKSKEKGKIKKKEKKKPKYFLSSVVTILTINWKILILVRVICVSLKVEYKPIIILCSAGERHADRIEKTLHNVPTLKLCSQD